MCANFLLSFSLPTSSKTNGEKQSKKFKVPGVKALLESGNIYRLRIVLAPPKSFLVWTPLSEHRNNIANFK
jgi:hypothetical protein